MIQRVLDHGVPRIFLHHVSAGLQAPAGLEVGVGRAVERPARWLVGFAPVEVDAGTSVEVTLEIPRCRSAHWADGWNHEAGTVTLTAGFAVASPQATATVELR